MITSQKYNDLLNKNLDGIMKKVSKMQLEIFDDISSENEIMNIIRIIQRYIKSKKRKIYGSHAINELIKDKSETDMLYKFDVNNVHDIDIYSPEPITDFIKICNDLHESGISYIFGSESLHNETYSIKVKGKEYCNISYVPLNIYNKIPFKELNGFIITHPNFIMIDMFRILTDPINSYWRLQKGVYDKFIKLEKYYPLPKNTNKPIQIIKHTDIAKNVLDIIYTYCKNTKTMIVIGYYVYYYYLTLNEIIKNVDIPYFEIISTDYKNDFFELLKLFEKDIDSELLTYEEYYPFFQFTDYSVNIYVKDVLVAKIYDNNKRCTPYIDVKTIKICNFKETDETIQIGTFPLVCMYLLINIMYARVNNGDKDIFYTLLGQSINYRNEYLKKHNKTIFDNTVFKEFVLTCIGKTYSLNMEKKQIIKNRKKLGKRIVIRYDPSEKVIEPYAYKFLNTSGNMINNDKNLQLTNIDENKSIQITDSETISGEEVSE